MKKINMVDLNGQYRKIRWQVNREMKKVINSSSFINGPVVKEFQNNLQQYLDVKHVIPCANGTDALQIALMALDLKRGDEVITTNFSFASTIEVILLLGLKPVVVDIDSRTFNINPSLIQDKITDRTRAIIPVHLFGQSCRMEEILEIANKNNLQVIEDNAQALGSKYKFSNFKVASGCGETASIRSEIIRPGVSAETTNADKPFAPVPSPVLAKTL